MLINLSEVHTDYREKQKTKQMHLGSTNSTKPTPAENPGIEFGASLFKL